MRTVGEAIMDALADDAYTDAYCCAKCDAAERRHREAEARKAREKNLPALARAQRQVMSPLMKSLYQRAKELGLDLPLGRAAYRVNRAYNDGCSSLNPRYAHLDAQEWLNEALRRVKPDTARRWAKHFRSGGSLKSLKRTAEQESKRRKKDWARDREIINADRRARRAEQRAERRILDGLAPESGTR